MSDNSYEFEITLPRSQAEALCEALEQITPAAGLLDKGEDWTVQAWFETLPDRAIIQQLIREVNGGEDAEFSLTTLAQCDWVAKSLEGLKPVRVGPFAVHGSHETAHFPPNLNRITIDAGLAFGTGHHGTTAACLLALHTHLKQQRPQHVLDLGTGTGVLAIAAAKALRQKIMASDIDPVAVSVARINAQDNNVGALVRPFTASGFHHPKLNRIRKFDLILANILARPLADLAPDIGKHLAPGGTVILSGLLTSQAHSVLAAYRAQNIIPVRRIIMDGWATLTMRG